MSLKFKRELWVEDIYYLSYICVYVYVYVICVYVYICARIYTYITSPYI